MTRFTPPKPSPWNKSKIKASAKKAKAKKAEK
jgi:hypothetical protein